MGEKRFRRNIYFLLALGLLFVRPVELSATQKGNEEQAPGRTMAQQATKEKQLWITADHTTHKVLQQNLNPGRR